MIAACQRLEVVELPLRASSGLDKLRRAMATGERMSDIEGSSFAKHVGRWAYTHALLDRAREQHRGLLQELRVPPVDATDLRALRLPAAGVRSDVCPMKGRRMPHTWFADASQEVGILASMLPDESYKRHILQD